jgi:ABC-type transport system involved in cytochrome c biogenesis permease subunit
LNALLKKLLTPLASLRITVALLVATMLLVYVGTLAQQTRDNFAVQKEFFHAWLVYMPFQDHVPFRDSFPFTLFISPKTVIPYGYMFPGGYALIVGILVNLLAAHTLRFKLHKGDLLLVPVLAVAGFFTWKAQSDPGVLWVTLTCLAGAAALAMTAAFHKKRTGVIVIHFGLILILVGELVTSMGQVETQMTLIEGDQQSWAHDVRHAELAVVDASPSDKDVVTALPADKMAAGDVLKAPGVPFEMRVDAFYPNANINTLAVAGPQPVKATTGKGTEIGLVPLKVFTGVGADASKVNAPAAYVTVLKDGKPLDTLLLSAVWLSGQRIEVDGKPYDLALRFRRYYKPYTIHLLDFTHDKWDGSEKAKNFAAHLKLLDPPNGVEREVTVRMNQPLRYAGDTIYQSGFDPTNAKLTTLQIVRNPGWLMPYLACAVGGLGMFIHFVMNLVGFLLRRFGGREVSMVSLLVLLLLGPLGILAFFVIWYYRRRAASATPRPAPRAPIGSAYTLQPKSRLPGLAIPAALAVLAVFYAAMHAAPRAAVTDDRKAFNLTEWGQLPVNFDGRAMPLDSLARNSLKVISGKQSFVIEDRDPATNKIIKETKVQAIQWLADVLGRRPDVTKYKMIRIDEPQVKALLGLSPDEKMFSYEDIIPDSEPIKFAEPDGWKPTQPSQFEYAAFETAPAGGGRPAKASLSEMADQTKLLPENLIRWARQIGLSTDTQALPPDRKSTTTVGGVAAKRFDLEGPGTGDGPLRTVAVVANVNQKTWVFKLTGPTAAVAAELPKFDALIGSVGFNDRMAKLSGEISRAQGKQEADRGSVDLYERKLIELGSHLGLFNRIAQQRSLLAVPPLKAGEKWRSLGDASKSRQAGTAEPAFEEFVVAMAAWRDNKPDDFNKAVTNYQKLLAQQAPDLASKASFEQFYNRFSPFWVSIGLYIFVVVLGCLSWMMLGGPLARGALAVMIVSLLVHAFGLISRMYISGRPPVTNLYSSAVFIAFVVVLTCVVLELIFRNGLAAVAAGFVGFMSLLVADGIEFTDAVSRGEGDTMAQLQAVLDTNFWLATHVVMITMGYAATFLAGALAIIYVIGGAISRATSGNHDEKLGKGMVYAGGAMAGGVPGVLLAHLLLRTPDHPLRKVFSDDGRKLFVKMVYGVVCFAMLLSFVGTILGGIWADQSWGRFWGWDSKENGAILLVLWNAVILHARWSGLVRDRGLMSLCILGNIVTAWSWFGTNELGIGLHSYGFTEGVVPKLLLFWGISLAFALFAVTPWASWRSSASTKA